MDKEWRELIDDIKAQRDLRLPAGDWDAKLAKIRCPLKQGLRVFWYYEEDKAFAAGLGGDPRVDCPYSGILMALPDTEMPFQSSELEWEDCLLVVDTYPVEKCYPEVYWLALGRLLDDERLVEIFRPGLAFVG